MTTTLVLSIAAVLASLVVVWGIARWRLGTLTAAAPAARLPEPDTASPIDQGVVNILASAAAQTGDPRTNDDLVDDALRIVTALGNVSVPALQRKLKIDFARATEVVALLEERGYVSEPNANRKRKVLPLAFERVASLDASE
jgi:hypothetical protein